MKPEVRLFDERGGPPAESADADVVADDEEIIVRPDVPEADAIEQYRSADPGERSEEISELPIEADVADAADQRTTVPGEDEYE